MLLHVLPPTGFQNVAVEAVVHEARTVGDAALVGWCHVPHLLHGAAAHTLLGCHVATGSAAVPAALSCI